MEAELARNWGMIVLRGVAALVFGLLVLFNPAISIALLVLLFGIFALVDGAAAAIAALAHRGREPHWVSLLIAGILGIGIGIVTLVWPQVTALALLFLIGAWAIVIGVGEIVTAIRLRQTISNEWVLLIAGVLSVAFGVIIVLFPGAGALAFAIWIGAFASIVGIMRIIFGLRLRSWGKTQGVV